MLAVCNSITENAQSFAESESFLVFFPFFFFFKKDKENVFVGFFGQCVQSLTMACHFKSNCAESINVPISAFIFLVYHSPSPQPPTFISITHHIMRCFFIFKRKKKTSFHSVWPAPRMV